MHGNGHLEEKIVNFLAVRPQVKMDILSPSEQNRFQKEKYDGIRQLILDPVKVWFISSVGVRTLVQAYKTKGEVARNACEQVMEVLMVTGYIHVLHIE